MLQTRKAIMKEEDEKISLFQIWLYGVIIFIVLMVIFSPRKEFRDTVFEDATQKLDRGQPLNEREHKRINDILNFHKK